MSAVPSQDDEKYVNGCRLSSSLLELQPFKVVVAEAKSMSEHTPKRQSHSNNNRYKDRRTYSTPGMNNGVVSQDSNSSQVPLLVDTSDEQTNRQFNSVSCDNIFDSPTLQVKIIPDKETTQTDTPDRSISVEYDPVTRGSSLPKPITRSTSQEKLIANESPNHVSTEQKKTKPRKPNRESLRRSRPDIRASQPNLPSANRTSASPNGSPEHNLSSVGGQQISLIHDYEELPTDVKILQQRQRISQSDAPQVPKVPPPTEPVFSPVSYQSQATPAVPERTKNPRQRLNPLYAGMHMNPYEHQTANGASAQKRPPTRCLRCLVAGVIVAVLFSILSVATLSLMILGYLEPIKGAESMSTVQQSELISRLQSEILALKNASNQAQKNIDDQLALTKIEVIDAVKSLNLSALRDPSTADVSQCVHRTFGIGSSSSQSEITSGEYFAEKGYVTTGVTCSASVGYVAYLHTREEDLEYADQGDDAQQARVFYRCTCHKSPNLALPTPRDRVECSIHYWQCPVL